MTAPTKPVILAVDDAQDLLALIGKALIADYKVKLASDGEKALALAAEDPQPDLILLDVGLPGISGFDVCRKLKEQPSTSGTVTAFAPQPAAPRQEASAEPEAKPASTVSLLNGAAPTVPAGAFENRFGAWR